MNIIFDQASLNKALTTVSKAVTNRSTIPAMKGIKIETESENTVIFTATDGEITIQKECEGRVLEGGKAVVPSKIFTEMIKKLPKDDVNIIFKDEKVSIKCRSYNSEIASFDPEEFPVCQEFDADKTVIFDKELFRKMVRRTSFAASTDESRGVIVGILIEMTDEGITMAALDGFRMAVAREKLTSEGGMKIIISARILSEIIKIMADETEDDEFVMVMDEKKTMFRIGTTRIDSRLLEGEYMDYASLLPKDFKCRVNADKNELAGVIERASLVMNKNNLIKMTIKDNSIMINSRSEEGLIEEEMIADVEGEGLEIGFNSKYLMDALKAVDDENIILKFNGSLSPCIMEPEEGNTFNFLILPVRLN